jgi:copper chaperone
MTTTTLTANGITCGGCANAIKKAVSALPGVTGVEVEVPTKQVTVTHDDRVDRPAVEAAVTRAGFQPS